MKQDLFNTNPKNYNEYDTEGISNSEEFKDNDTVIINPDKDLIPENAVNISNIKIDKKPVIPDKKLNKNKIYWIIINIILVTLLIIFIVLMGVFFF